MQHSENFTEKLNAEADILFYACTGHTCPDDIKTYYNQWIRRERNATALSFPPVLCRLPRLLAVCEPLPGVNAEFDARRAAILTLAESYPTSAPLFYRCHPQSWVIVFVLLSFDTMKELLKLPLRATLGRWLWA